MQQLRVGYLFCLLLSFLAFGCQQPSSSGAQENSESNNEVSSSAPTLNVYTYKESVENKDLKQRFFNLNGANVNFNLLDSKTIIDQFKAGQISPDLLILDGVEHVLAAKEAGLLQPFSTGEMEENIPFKYKDQEGYWAAIGKSGIVVVFDKNKVQTGAIKHYSDLTDTKYKGKIALSSASEKVNRHLLAGMIEGVGERAATSFARSLLANKSEQVLDSEEAIIKAVANGEVEMGLVDISSVLKFRYSGNPDDFKAAENLGVVYPVSKDGITYLTFRVIAMPKNPSDRDIALRFAEYLTNESAQQAISAGSFLFPTNPMVVPSDFLIDEGGYRDLENDLNTMAQQNEKVLSIMSSVGWE